MTRIEKTVTIAAPINKVFGFASDWRNFKSYFTYVQEVKPSTEKTQGVGSCLSLKVRFLGRIRDSQWTCTGFTEGSEFSYDALLMGVTAAKKWRFTLAGDSTLVTFTLEYEPAPPVIGGLLDILLIKPQWKKLYDQSFDELKRLMEAGKV